MDLPVFAPVCSRELVKSAGLYIYTNIYMQKQKKTFVFRLFFSDRTFFLVVLDIFLGHSGRFFGGKDLLFLL